MRRNPLDLRVLCLTIFSITTVFLPSQSEADVLSINDKRVPKTQEDLLDIQDALIAQLARVSAATVSIKVDEGFGSGVIVSPAGLILTAAHVTTGVDKDLTVVLNDGTEYKAVSMGLVSTTDAAMMRIIRDDAETEDFPYVEINRAGDYRLGDWVFTLGHSGGFDKVRGPVARLGRITRDSEDTLHSDCKVIGGDSGGPLYDLNGELIGIHSRVESSVEQNKHVPMREYLKHWDALSRNSFIGDGLFAQRPVKGSGFMGIKSSDTDDGILVELLLSEGPAEKAGVMVGDLIIKIDGAEVADKESMKAILKEMAEGERLELIVLRDAEEVAVKFKLGKR